MTFGYNPQINFGHFFHSFNLVFFGLNPNPFETLQVFLSRTKDMHYI